MALTGSEPIVSSITVEGLFVWALKERVTPQLKAKLKVVGIDLDKPLHAAYTNDVWNKAVACTVEELYPGLTGQQACFEIGKTLMLAGLPATILGRAGIQLLRLIGPERTLMRVQHNHRATNNFTTAEMKKLAPNHFQIQNGILPEFHKLMTSHPLVSYGAMNQGMYTGLLTLLNVKNPKVTWRDVDLAAFKTEYDLKWDV